MAVKLVHSTNHKPLLKQWINSMNFCLFHKLLQWFTVKIASFWCVHAGSCFYKEFANNILGVAEIVYWIVYFNNSNLCSLYKNAYNNFIISVFTIHNYIFGFDIKLYLFNWPKHSTIQSLLFKCTCKEECTFHEYSLLWKINKTRK